MLPKHRPPRRQAGFTLIELLVVVTVSAIMLGLAVPSFKKFTASQRVKTASTELTTSLLMARSEAVKRNRAITLAGAGTDWAGGWTVRDTATSPVTTIVSQNAFNGLTITPNFTAIGYQGNGRISAAGLPSGASTATFELTSTADTDTKRCVKVDLTGVPSTSSGACS